MAEFEVSGLVGGANTISVPAGVGDGLQFIRANIPDGHSLILETTRFF